MDFAKHIQSRDSTISAAKDVEVALQQLTSSFVRLRGPLEGPLLLFHHVSTAVERCRQLSLLLTRLHNNRVELFKYDILEDSIRRREITDEEDQLVSRELYIKSHAIDDEIVLDFQTMLIFGGMLLDDWAQTAGYVFGTSKPGKNTFDALAKSDGAKPFEEFWGEFKEDILWLDAVPRLIRNKFIVHREQPWQTGHTRSIHFLDWKFWVPVAVGWLTETEINTHKAKLIALLNFHNISLGRNNVHELVFEGLDNIAKFSLDERKEILKIASIIGFGTPTFQQFGKRIFDFLLRATHFLVRSAELNPNLINFGRRQI
jgi:hypothetical protein